MFVRFWGVRGSIASPGPETARIGGNTSCVEVRAGAQTMIFDAGTGLRALGDELLRETNEAGNPPRLLLSHLHWDHIQGLPFYVPLYVPGRELEVYGPRDGEGSLESVLRTQMMPPAFPVRFDELRSRIALHEIADGATLRFGDVVVTAARLNHPGGVLGYRIEHAGRSVVYATDTEHYSCVDPKLAKLAHGADVLIYDAMYTPEEYRGDVGSSKVGWGHSTFEAGAQVARHAGVSRLVLFHHDPARTDSGVDEIVDRARRHFSNVEAAREGLRIELAPLRSVA